MNITENTGWGGIDKYTSYHELEPFRPKIYSGKGKVKAEKINMIQADGKIEIGKIVETDLDRSPYKKILSLD